MNQSDSLSHLSSTGEVSMVDITDKSRSKRRALAGGTVLFPGGALEEILNEGSPKGDLFATARVAGIEAAKQTPDAIPLTHPIELSHVEIKVDPQPDGDSIKLKCEARARDATGVEMEALNGVSGAALTLYDMCKGKTKGIQVTDIRLLEKEGGSSGHWSRDQTYE